MAVERVRQMSVEAFLDFAEASEYRYEYIDGEPVKMSGGKLNHFRIIHRLQVLLDSLLAVTGCEVIASGMLVRVGESTLVDPDVSVVCGEPQTELGTRVLLNPTLVVEVLSPSSIDHDRVLKLNFYQSVASIQAYLIVEQDEMSVELYTRGEAGWDLRTFSRRDDEIPLDSLNCSLPLRDIYRQIEFGEA
ncbi:MAG: Uma2 family endonuclease [Chloroflexi bacterium]|nr:Uma2 family endonuclease [Chloroflexota bacterium]